MLIRRELAKLGVTEQEEIPKWRLAYPLHSRNGRVGFKSSTGRSIFPRTPAYTLDEFRRDEKYRTAHAVRKRMYGKAAPPMDIYHQPLRRTKGLPAAVRELRPAIEKIRQKIGTVKQQSEDERYKKLGFRHGFKRKEKEKAKEEGFWLPEGTAFFKGMRVEVNWRQKGRWFTGKIRNINLNYKNGQEATTFDVQYEWGVPTEEGVTFQNIRPTCKRFEWFKGQTIVVNHLGKGVWFTATVAHVHNEKYNDEGTIDIRYDSGFPSYETRIPYEYVRHVDWHVGQPVLGNYKNNGRWCKAIIEKCRGDVTWGKGTVTIRYTEWGDDRLESNVDQSRLRPCMEDNPNLMPGPGQHMISLVLKAPSIASKSPGPNSSSVMDSLASSEHDGIPSDLDAKGWFWRRSGPQNSYREENKEEGAGDKTKSHWVLPKKTGKFQLKVRLAGETVPKMYLSYGLNGHFIPKPKKKLNPFEKKLEEQRANLQLRQKRLAREKFANRDFGQSSPAMIAISGPGALPLKRRGSGMERITLKLPHKYLQGVGMDLPRFASSIDAIKYEANYVYFYLTVKPGNSTRLRVHVQKGTNGTGTVVTSATKDIRSFQNLSTENRGRTSKAVALSQSSSAMSRFEHFDAPFSSSTLSSVSSSKHLLNACNCAQRGEREKVLATLLRHPALVHQRQEKQGRTILQAAAYSGNVGLVRALLALGADSSIQDDSGKMATDIARERAESEGLHKRLKRQLYYIGGLCDPKSIFRACIEDDMLRIGVLLAEAPTSVRQANNHGMTALHYAVMYRRINIIEKLTAVGADWGSPNIIGQTPTDLIWDVAPASSLNLRTIEAEQRVHLCLKEEDRTRRVAANALRKIREADGPHDKEVAENQLHEAQVAHQESISATEKARIHVDVSKAHLGEDITAAIHEIIDARERGLKLLVPYIPPKKKVLQKPVRAPWTPTSSPKRAAEHSVYAYDVDQKKNWESRVSKKSALYAYDTGSMALGANSVSSNNPYLSVIHLASPVQKNRRPDTASNCNRSPSHLAASLKSPSAISQSKTMRPYSASVSSRRSIQRPLSKSMPATKVKHPDGKKKCKRKEQTLGQVSSPMRGFRSVPGTEYGKPSTLPWPPPLDSPLFETWVEAISGKGVDRSLEKEEAEKCWNELYGGSKRR
jgi:hypothetical protein